MINLFRNSLRIRVSRSRITVLKSSGWMRPKTSVVDDIQIPAEAISALGCFTELLDSVFTQSHCTNMGTTIVLADDLVRYFTVVPPQNAATLQDCRAAAAMRFQSLYDESTANWKLAANWDAQHAFLACAIPESFYAAICQTCATHRLVILKLIPHFVSVANHWHSRLKPGTWLGAMHESHLTVGAVEHSGLCTVRTTPLPTDGGLKIDWIVHYLHQEALRLNLAMPTELLLCGDLSSPSLTPDIESLRIIRLPDPLPYPEHSPQASGVRLACNGSMR